MKRYWIHIILIILLSACVKEADWDVPEDGTKYIVVDGILTNEYNGCKGYDARLLQYQEFSEDVLVMNYNTVLN